MSPKPTGRLSLFGDRADLELERQFKAAIEDVWQSITDPESMSRWIGTFSGEPGPGKTVQFRMLFEQGDAVSDVLIEVCEPPRRLVVSAQDDNGTWHLELLLRSAGDTTTLRFVQHLMLVAARTGAPRPDFADYYPSQRDYYLKQLE